MNMDLIPGSIIHVLHNTTCENIAALDKFKDQLTLVYHYVQLERVDSYTTSVPNKEVQP